MKFKALRISDWKQFQNIDIDFHDRLTILTGANGSGKTTLLHLLAKHFGWEFSELATPTKDRNNGKISYIANWYRWFKKKDNNDAIGKITYSDNSFANLIVPKVNSAIYNIEIHNRKLLLGLNILSHRSAFKYQNIPSIATKKRNRKEAYSLIEQEVKKEQIVPLTNGELVNISQVPDEVFSSKMMGDGFAMKTSDGIIVSPVEGTIVTVFPTKHAVTINSVDGREVLIHLGVDTVSLKGEGFETFVEENQKVKVGDKLVKMDVEFIEKNAKSSMPIVVFTNLSEGESVKLVEGTVKAGELNKIEIVK